MGRRRTLLALRQLAVPRPNAPVLGVLTTRTGAGGPALRETLSVIKQADATFLQLTAISSAAVAATIRDALRANADESLLKLAMKAHGNPFLVKELVEGLDEEGRLDVVDGRALATGRGLPQRLGTSMEHRLARLSNTAAEVVRVAAVLPDRFSASLLAAMLERQPASLVSAVTETVRADLLVEDGDQLRFRHELLREATRLSMPQSLRRAMERQSASAMLSMGAAPVAVATQLVRSAEPGDKEAIGALLKAAKAVSHSDAGAAADLSRHALELLPSGDADHGRVVAETVVLLNRARHYEQAEQLAVAALSRVSAEDEAEIRLRLPAFTKHSTEQRVQESRRALELRDISDVTRARHLAWLAYNLMRGNAEHRHQAAAEAVKAAALTDDLEAKVVSDLTRTCLDWQAGYVSRAVDRFEELSKSGHWTDAPAARLLLATNHVNLLAVIGRIEEATRHLAVGKERAREEHNAMALDIWAVLDGTVHLAAGRLTEARGAVEFPRPPAGSGATDLDMVRMVVGAQVALSTDDRNLLQEKVAEAYNAQASPELMVRRTSAYVLALAASHRSDLPEAMRGLNAEISPYGSPILIDHAILSARVASAAGDAGLRARVMRGCDLLERERPTVPLFTAVARHARGILECDSDALIAAAQLLASSSRPLLYAAAAEDAGVELAVAGRGAEALEQLNAAFDTYLRHQAIADARRVGRELRKLGVERRVVSQRRSKTGWDSLTEAELKVVNLIARGATNRAVADQLYLSLHTVKTHVHNAFAKLGVSSRAQLAQCAR